MVLKKPADSAGRLRIGVADPDTAADHQSESLQPEELIQDGVFIRLIVQKDVARGGGDMEAFGRFVGRRPARREAVNEEELFVLYDLQGRKHFLLPGREARAHVVVDADRVRNIRDIFIHNPENSGGPVTDVESSGTRIDLLVIGLHRLMKKYLVSFSVDFDRKGMGVGQEGQDGIGDRGVQVQKHSCPATAETDIVDDECDAGWKMRKAPPRALRSKGLREGLKPKEETGQKRGASYQETSSVHGDSSSRGEDPCSQEGLSLGIGALYNL